MRTTFIVYLVIWTMIVLPLLAIGIRRVIVRRIGEKTKIRWGIAAAFLVAIIGVTAFILTAYQVTVTSRYELAAERYVDLHAEFVAGLRTKEAYQAEIDSLRAPGAAPESFSLFDEEVFATPVSNNAIRFQISSWIIPKYYADDPVFPETTVIDENNPVFVIYLLENGTDQTYYLLRMQEDTDGWKITYQAKATQDQIKAAQSALPSQKNGQWFSAK